MELKDIDTEFKKPSSRYRGVPFWSWNGLLDEDELIRQIHVLKDMGFGGFFMHSRTGLQTEYLGEQWFDLIRACTDEAKKLDMSAWIYDEDRWPSGTAGGLVTKNKQYRMKFISMYENIEDIPHQSGLSGCPILGSFAIKFENDQIVDYYALSDQRLKQYLAHGTTQDKINLGNNKDTGDRDYENSDSACDRIRAGYVVRYFIYEEMAEQEFYNGYTYLDTLNREATDAFIQSTHEKYREKCGDLFGEKILGIFTDEPHRGSILNGFGINNANKMNMMPYTYTLFDEFKKIKGYNLADRLPELYYVQAGYNVNLVMYDYIGVIQQMFLDNFAKPYYEWCKANQLIMTGHVLHEDSLAIQTIFQGSVARFYEYMGYPGVDILTEGNRAFWVAKQVQSVSRQLDKPFVLSELYGCSGWQLNFESHRDVGVWQALFGITLRCHHLSWYTMAGQAKRDYPASIFFQSNWYSDYAYIEDYFARLNVILTAGEPVCDTLVLNPVESMWLQPRKGWMKNYFENTLESVQSLEDKYVDLFHILTAGQVDFDYGDEDIIQRHYHLDKREGRAVLNVGKSAYHQVVIAGMLTIRKSTLDILQEFEKAGGKVCILGDAPTRIDGKLCNFDMPFLHVPYDNESILQCLRQEKPFYSLTGEGMSDIVSTLRQVGDDHYLVVLNINRERAYDKLQLELADRLGIVEYNIESGKQVVREAKTRCFAFGLNKGECRVFKLTQKMQCVAFAHMDVVERKVELNYPMSYLLSEPNLLPLDMPKFALGDESFAPPMEILQVDRVIRTRVGLPLRGGEMIQPWYKHKYFGEEQERTLGRLRLQYEFDVEVMPENVQLIAEQSTRFRMSLNGHVLDKKIDGYFIDPCFDCIQLPSDGFVMGRNFLDLECELNDELQLECLYLAGQFGVRLENVTKTIIKLPDVLAIGDIGNQGLPFYSGRVLYDTGLRNVLVNVTMQRAYGALCKVMGNEEHIVAFAPYTAKNVRADGALKLEVVLTRRNTFGPLHLASVLAPSYGPESFLMDLSDNYALIEQGILDAVEIDVLKCF